MSETTEIAVMETTNTVGLLDEIQALKEGKTPVLSTIDGDDRESRIATLKAMTDSTAVDDVLGEVITLANYVIQPVEMENEQTKQMQTVPRVILITDEGDAYHAISGGIFSALKNISSMLGMPGQGNENWPVQVAMVREKTRAGNQVFTLKVVG